MDGRLSAAEGPARRSSPVEHLAGCTSAVHGNDSSCEIFILSVSTIVRCYTVGRFIPVEMLAIKEMTIHKPGTT